jgi:hypothetical protein
MAESTFPALLLLGHASAVIFSNGTGDGVGICVGVAVGIACVATGIFGVQETSNAKSRIAERMYGFTSNLL